MIHLNLTVGAKRAPQILCLGCHSDDIEIGCGGSVLRFGGAVSAMQVSLGRL